VNGLLMSHTPSEMTAKFVQSHFSRIWRTIPV